MEIKVMTAINWDVYNIARKLQIDCWRFHGFSELTFLSLFLNLTFWRIGVCIHTKTLSSLMELNNLLKRDFLVWKDTASDAAYRRTSEDRQFIIVFYRFFPSCLIVISECTCAVVVSRTRIAWFSTCHELNVMRQFWLNLFDMCIFLKTSFLLFVWSDMGLPVVYDFYCWLCIPHLQMCCAYYNRSSLSRSHHLFFFLVLVWGFQCNEIYLFLGGLFNVLILGMLLFFPFEIETYVLQISDRAETNGLQSSKRNDSLNGMIDQDDMDALSLIFFLHFDCLLSCCQYRILLTIEIYICLLISFIHNKRCATTINFIKQNFCPQTNVIILTFLSKIFHPKTNFKFREIN